MGGLISGVGTIAGGIAQANTEQQAAQKEWDTNDALAQYGARGARLRGAAQEGQARMLGSQMVAKQRLGYANSGIDATSGTAASVQADTAAMSELDAQTVKNNAAREAWGFKVAQEQAHQQYVGKVAQAQSQAQGSLLTGAGQIIGGAAGL